MSSGFGRQILALAALILVPGAVLAGTAIAARRLARLGRQVQDLHGCFTGAGLVDEPPARLEVPAVGGVLASLGRARRQGERQIELQRNRVELFKCMRGDQDPEGLAASVLAFVVPAAGAQAGAFYLARPGQRLILAGAIGTDESGPPPAMIRTGQGLVGRIAAQRRMRVVRHDDGDGLRLATAAGPAPPGGLFVAPYHLGGRLKGVLVLAWLDAEAAAEPDFLRQSAESVAMALDSANSRARVQRLLEATRNQAVILARQQRELQVTNAELARADRYKSEFLANMSHELRTPLNSMLIMSQVLAENRTGHLSADEVDTALTINRAGSELLLIINDILDMTRVEAGKLDLHHQQLEPARLVADLEDLFQPVAARQGLRLRMSVADDTPATLTSDPLRLSQILKNLLNNAIKFTAQGEVALTVRRPLPDECPDGPGDESWLAFAVTDTGIGMDAATVARVCEPFFQGDGSIGRRYGGSGLGLSISAGLASLLGGHLQVSSTEGRGSTFVLVVPALAAAPVPPPAAVRTATPPAAELGQWRGRLAGRVVLLADDDMRTVFQLSHLLDGMEAEVRIARSADEAVALAAARPGPDLLCLAAGLFAGRDDDLERLVGGDQAGPRPCLWLGAAPAADGPDGPATSLDKPLDAMRVAAACATLCDPRLQPA